MKRRRSGLPLVARLRLSPAVESAELLLRVGVRGPRGCLWWRGDEQLVPGRGPRGRALTFGSKHARPVGGGVRRDDREAW